MSNEVPTKKIPRVSYSSEGDSQGSGESSKRGAFERIGAYFSSHWVYSAIIAPVVLIISICVLFSINKGGKEK